VGITSMFIEGLSPIFQMDSDPYRFSMAARDASRLPNSSVCLGMVPFKRKTILARQSYIRPLGRALNPAIWTKARRAKLRLYFAAKRTAFCTSVIRWLRRKLSIESP
jgi:hypothetical protein